MARFSPFLEGAKRSIYLLTVPLPLWANYRLWRGCGHSWRAKLDTSASDRVWLEGVIRWSFLAGLIVFALAPTNIMRWHVFSLFHVAVLPLVLAGAGLLKGKWSKPAAKGVWVYTTLSIVVVVAVLFGSPAYRCGGDRCDLKAVTMPRLRSDHPMLEVLGIQESCPVVINDPQGWWPCTFGEDPSAVSPPD